MAETVDQTPVQAQMPETDEGTVQAPKKKTPFKMDVVKVDTDEVLLQMKSY
jgi:hypothetical protein